LTAGADAKTMVISNAQDFLDVTEEEFKTEKAWNLSAGDGRKVVYVKFYNKDKESSGVISSRIILDTVFPELSVNYNEKYNPEEGVILKGKTESNLSVFFSWEDQYGITKSDTNGNWSTNLGSFLAGEHLIVVKTKDEAENATIKDINIKIESLSEQPSTTEEQQIETTQKPGVTVGVVANELQTIGSGLVSDAKSVLENSTNFLKSTLGFENEEIIEEENPKPALTIQKSPPVVLTGKWKLLPMKFKSLK
jgi:hypothetical protein